MVTRIIRSHAKWQLIVVLLACFSSGLGQVVRIGEPQFSPEAKLLALEQLQRLTTDLELLDIFGVEFYGQQSSVPTVDWFCNRCDFAPRYQGLVRNEPLEGEDSTGSGLVIGFAYPMRRVGFQVGGGKPETVATITAFNEAGETLGSVQQAGVEASEIDGNRKELRALCRLGSYWTQLDHLRTDKLR